MRIYSIFSSINGEVCASHQGSLCTFIRLAGCSVGCEWCDTKYAANPESGKELTPLEVLEVVKSYRNRNVTITGGEPMQQMKELHELVYGLRSQDYNISIETSGEVPFKVSDFAPTNNKSYKTGTVNFVTDIKLGKHNNTYHYKSMGLTETDFFKIVIKNEVELVTAILIKEQLQVSGCKAKFAFSPCAGHITPKELIKGLKMCGQTDAIINIQLHKVLELVEDNLAGV